ncbi:hypothetical protein Pst134EA_011515 [Puccinia striiformis f. sp. tritici]|uniref:hypothetical protein n=1 Tax=Puccinia striiformis f. sp. tritici TaxID=168172 RepID=UPI002008C0B6|nr:hypothetical protein Pst134EA_011515 [Puccinia striiformis f. sp. tritici]KAH9456297.1 hypothetical protein Pst134EB_012499 [Puccinia striiformis f. sp. tritici]KAH9467896.1 hypothetical protein Pst134EA_011515 [Puccinia striiformis f. sp. tritici]
MVGKSTNWPNGLKSHLTAESTIYEHFIHILTTESDKSYRSAGPLIQNAIISGHPPLESTVHLNPFTIHGSSRQKRKQPYPRLAIIHLLDQRGGFGQKG